MERTVARARQMLQFPGVIKKSAAEAMGVSSSAISRILNGQRDISADEFARLEAYYRTFRGEGVEETSSPDLSPTVAPSPIYPARALASGDWVVDLAAEPIQHSLAPPPIRGFAEVYGFYAPDSAAWPRFKLGEIVWISPTEIALAGDDVFISTQARGANSLQGMLCELAPTANNSLKCRRFSTGDVIEMQEFSGRILKIAARQR